MHCVLKSFISCTHEQLDYVLPQSHNYYELVFYATGTGKTTINGELYNYSAGDIAIMTPNTVHDEETSSVSDVYCCLFEYNGDIELKNGLYKIFKKQTNDVELYDKFLLLFKNIRDELRHKFNMYDEYLNLILSQILIIFLRININMHSSSDSIEYVKLYMKENFSKPINFYILADHIGYSYDRFRHSFKERNNISPGKYLLNIRISRAKEMLEKGSMPIKRISELCGYQDVSRFIQIFRNEIGVTPLKFRQMLHDTPEEVLNLKSISGRIKGTGS